MFRETGHQRPAGAKGVREAVRTASLLLTALQSRPEPAPTPPAAPGLLQPAGEERRHTGAAPPPVTLTKLGQRTLHPPLRKKKDVHPSVLRQKRETRSRAAPGAVRRGPRGGGGPPWWGESPVTDEVP